MSIRRWIGLMQDVHLWLAAGAFVLTVLPAMAHAEDPRVEVLERKLQERDKVILELLERVEALERRVGVARPASRSGEAPAAAQKPLAAPGVEKQPAQARGEAPGTVVVEAGDAERALERSLTREGAVLLPRGILEIEPGLSYARQEDSAPRFLTAGGALRAGETERNADNLRADAALRLGLPWDSQLEIGLPYRYRTVETVTRVGFAATGSSSQSGAGLGDVRVGLARTLLREGLWRPDLVGRLTWDTDSGERADDGVALGGGFHELRGSLTAIKRQDPVAFFGGLSYEHSFEHDLIRPGAVISANFGSFIALSPETSVRVLLSGGYQDETEFSGSEVDGSDRTLATFVVGGSTLLAPGTLLNLSAGIGLTDDADDFSISLSLPIRFHDRLY